MPGTTLTPAPRAAILALLLLPASAFAQSATTGAIEGTLRDPAGALLPAADAALRNQSTGQSQRHRCDDKGACSFPLLAPGSYDLTLTAPGFKRCRVPRITVNVAETASLEVTLERGRSSADCRTRFTAVAISTGTLVDQKTITAVPLNTRNFTQVLSMSSGSAASVNNAGTLGRGSSSVNVNGNTSSGAYTIDGAWAPSTVPSPDAISEFKIQTSQYDAVYGAMVPNTNLVTKRGQNSLHGAAWEFLRNDIFNANAFFRNSTGQPKPNLKQNQFGATTGGAIRPNRLFFFASYQGTRQVNGLDPTSVSNPILPVLPSDRSPAAIASAFCPANNPGSRYLTFAGGRQLDCHNASTSITAPINPIALRLLQMKGPDGAYLIPSPQSLTGDGLGFSSFSQPSTYNEHHYLANFDYLRSARHVLAGRIFGATVDQLRTFGSPGGYPGAAVLPGFGASQKLNANDIATSVKLTSNFSPTLVSEAVFAYTRNITDTFAGDGLPSASSLGMSAADPLFAYAPEITILGPLGTFRLFGTNPNDNHFSTTTWSGTGNLSWIHGKQRLRLGGVFLSQYNGRSDTGGARGKLTFQSFSDFLLGLSAADNLSPAGRSNIQSINAFEGAGPQGEVEYRYRRYYGALYVQDDLKLSTRLTLNLGLRWEYIGPSFDEAGTIGNIDPTALFAAAVPPATGTYAGYTVGANYNPALINPYTGKPFGPPPAGVRIRDSKSFYENSAPLDTFAPRAGLAWQPFGTGGRLVLGGGYGWFNQTPVFSANGGSAPLFNAAPFAQTFTNSDTSNGTASLANPFPATTLGFVPRTPTSKLSDRIAGPDYRIPRLQQWNASAKLRLMKDLFFDLGYVGSRASRLLRSRGLNQPLLIAGSSTALNAPLRVPVLGETPTALLASEFAGSSTYHSLQATLRRQFAKGLAFQAAYTFSRAENDTTTYNDQTNPAASRGRASFDRTHRLITNFNYQLPTPKALPRLLNTLLADWSAAGIAIVQSGMPMTLTDPAGGSIYGRAGTSTITLCPGANLATTGSLSERMNHWINLAAICPAPVLGPDGATGYGNAAISILNGPGQINTDFSLGRSAKVGGLREDARLLFRAEFYNALNHPQFANPGTTLNTAGFGQITQSAVAPRLIQFGLKYLF